MTSASPQSDANVVAIVAAALCAGIITLTVFKLHSTRPVRFKNTPIVSFNKTKTE